VADEFTFADPENVAPGPWTVPGDPWNAAQWRAWSPDERARFMAEAFSFGFTPIEEWNAEQDVPPLLQRLPWAQAGQQNGGGNRMGPEADIDGAFVNPVRSSLLQTIIDAIRNALSAGLDALRRLLERLAGIFGAGGRWLLIAALIALGLAVAGFTMGEGGRGNGRR
jgi:hypothetical protein